MSIDFVKMQRLVLALRAKRQAEKQEQIRKATTLDLDAIEARYTPALELMAQASIESHKKLQEKQQLNRQRELSRAQYHEAESSCAYFTGMTGTRIPGPEQAYAMQQHRSICGREKQSRYEKELRAIADEARRIRAEGGKIR